MRFTILSLVFCSLLAEFSTAQGNCPVTGIATLAEIGTGTAPGGASVLVISFDARTCSLVTDINAPPVGNTAITQHWLVIGFGLLSQPIDLVRPFLGQRFLAGSQLWVRPASLQGPFAARTSSHRLPPTLALVGRSFALQAIPVFFTTIHMTTDLGITQAILFQFL